MSLWWILNCCWNQLSFFLELVPFCITWHTLFPYFTFLIWLFLWELKGQRQISFFQSLVSSTNRDCCAKFATGLNIIASHSSESIWVMKLSFCQNNSPMGETFWQKDSLITQILFELCLFWYLATGQILGITLYLGRKIIIIETVAQNLLLG